MTSHPTPNGAYLSKRGYVIRKDSISDEELKYLKKTLIARPLQDDKYTFFNKQDNSFSIYIETKNKISQTNFNKKEFLKLKELSNGLLL